MAFVLIVLAVGLYVGLESVVDFTSAILFFVDGFNVCNQGVVVFRFIPACVVGVYKFKALFNELYFVK